MSAKCLVTRTSSLYETVIYCYYKFESNAKKFINFILILSVPLFGKFFLAKTLHDMHMYMIHDSVLVSIL